MCWSLTRRAAVPYPELRLATLGNGVFRRRTVLAKATRRLSMAIPDFPAESPRFLVHPAHAWRARIDRPSLVEVASVMHAEPELTLTSTYHPCNQAVRILRGHLAAALRLLDAKLPSGSSIHAARQELKRARALLRLLRESIDPEHFRREDATLRQAAQQLNDVRDTEVVFRVFSRLQDAVKNQPPPNLQPLRRLLLEERRNATSNALREPVTAARTLLLQVKKRTRDWLISNDLDLLTRAMQRTYRRGRSCYRTACESPTDHNLHAWRRHVKYSAYQLEAIGSLAPRRIRKRLRRSAKLAKVLGRDHDLALLQQRIADARLDAASELRLADAIRCERANLQRRALQLGQRLYRAKPRKFQPLN
jgi:CHAD domain-containing protein